MSCLHTFTDANNTFIIVHGGFHPPTVYRQLSTALGTLTNAAILTPQLPTLNPAKPNLTHRADTAHLTDLIKNMVDRGSRIVLIAHSYAAIPAAAATAAVIAEGYSTRERFEKCLSGGIEHFIVISGLVALERGMNTQWTATEGWVRPFVRDEDGAKLFEPTRDAIQMFYNDVDRAEAEDLFKQLLPQASTIFDEPIEHLAADIKKVPKTYIVCEDDRAMPAGAQEDWAGLGGFRLASIDTGHSPFIVGPAKTAQLIKKIVDDVGEEEEAG